MKHNFRHRTLLLCHPKRWEAQCQVLDEIEIEAAWMDDDDEKDIFGAPIPKMEISGDTAIVPIKGVIDQGIPKLFKKFGYVDTDDIAADLARAGADANIKNVWLEVNSPGGSVGGVPELGAQVASLAASGKSVKVFATSINSAAYWIGAAADELLVTPSADVGSIGVYSAYTNTSKAFEMFGYRMEVFKSGKHKGAGLPGTDLTDEQKAHIQEQVETLGALFRAHVQAYRTRVQAEDMEGQSFLGFQAAERGLATGVRASLREALNS